MNYDTATALSPLDGRYASKLDPLRMVFSEYGLIFRRLEVEIRWLQKLTETSEIREVKPLSPTSNAHLEAVLSSFSSESAAAVKTIERTTNHDVKAIEYFLKDAIASDEALAEASEFVHFACTSEDINNLSHALMLRDGVPVLTAETVAFALSSASLPLSVSFDNRPELLFPMLRVFPSVTLPVSFVPETSLLTPLTVIVIVFFVHDSNVTVMVMIFLVRDPKVLAIAMFP